MDRDRLSAMARQIYTFTVTTPPGSTPAAPVPTPLKVPPMTVDEIRVHVPPGPSGQLGFALAVGGQQIIPYQAGTFFTPDDERMDFPLDGYPESGAWAMLAYNVGAYPHTLQLSFFLSLLQASISLPQAPIPADLLAPSPSALLPIPAL